MRIVKCLQDILDAGTLEEGDMVFFNELKYKVHNRFLQDCPISDLNSIIFDKNEVDPYVLACEVYGYKPLGGFWSAAKDYVALTRLVAALYCKLDLFIKPEPSAQLQLQLRRVGKKWCAKDKESGVVGFGDTPDEAVEDFDKLFGERGE